MNKKFVYQVGNNKKVVYTELVEGSSSGTIASRIKPPATVLCWLTVHTELVAGSGSATITSRIKPQATVLYG